MNEDNLGFTRPIRGTGRQLAMTAADLRRAPALVEPGEQDRKVQIVLAAFKVPHELAAAGNFFLGREKQPRASGVEALAAPALHCRMAEFSDTNRLAHHSVSAQR